MPKDRWERSMDKLRRELRCARGSSPTRWIGCELRDTQDVLTRTHVGQLQRKKTLKIKSSRRSVKRDRIERQQLRGMRVLSARFVERGRRRLWSGSLPRDLASKSYSVMCPNLNGAARDPCRSIRCFCSIELRQGCSVRLERGS